MWFWDENKVQCEDCLKYQKTGDFKFKCFGISFVDKCILPVKEGSDQMIMTKLTQDNKQFVAFFQKIIPWLSNGMGGFQISAVIEYLDVYKKKYHFSDNLYPWVMDRCTIMIQAYNQVKEKNKK